MDRMKKYEERLKDQGFDVKCDIPGFTPQEAAWDAEFWMFEELAEEEGWTLDELKNALAAGAQAVQDNRAAKARWRWFRKFW